MFICKPIWIAMSSIQLISDSAKFCIQNGINYIIDAYKLNDNTIVPTILYHYYLITTL